MNSEEPSFGEGFGVEKNQVILFIAWGDQGSKVLREGLSLGFLCVCVCGQSCPTLHNPIDCSPPGSLSMTFPRQEWE